MHRMTRIVFMGSPDFAVPSLRALAAAYLVVGVVTQPDRPAGRGRGLRAPAVKLEAGRLGLPVIQPEKANTPDVLQKLREWKPDLVVVAAFGQLLRPGVLGLPQHGCVNVHASLLPRWRGAAPIQAAIAAGDPETGVSIMKMDEGMDTGDLLAQRSTPIRPDDTGGTLTEKLALLGAEALHATLPAYLAGGIEARPQDSALATNAPRLRKEHGLLNPETPAAVLARLVRAFQPWPGAFIRLNGETLKILRAHEETTALRPGCRGAIGRLPAWGTAEGALVLDEVQLAGRKPMGGSEFLSGMRDWLSQDGGT
jgi:methionyl-tRNA formyltransferase